MEFARTGFDIGLFSSQRDGQLRFWQDTVGLQFDHMGKLGGGIQQHRHHLFDAVLKMNHARDPLPAMPASGYRELQIARSAVGAPTPLVDPDGNRVILLPPAACDFPSYQLVMAVNDIARHAAFFEHALGLQRLDGTRFALGDARIMLTTAQSPIQGPSHWRGPGFRYLTVQVMDAHAALTQALAAGAGRGEPLVRLGDLVNFGFIRDPDGNWIEISERTTFTGRELSIARDDH